MPDDPELTELRDALQREYNAVNGVAPLTPTAPPERAGDSSDALPIVQLAYTAFPGEVEAEMDAQRQAQGYAALSRQQMGDIASRVVVRHSAELYREQAVIDGNAAPVRQLAPGYVQRLNNLGVSDEQIVEAATRMFPGVDRRTALQRWAQQAQKMGDYDPRMGDTRPDPAYVPVRESSD